MIDMLLLLIVVGVLMVAVVVDLAAVLGWLRRLRSDRVCQRNARGVKEVGSRRRDGATGRNVE